MRCAGSVLIATLFWMSTPAAAQTAASNVRSLDGTAPAAASIEEVAWIAGSWVGTGFGGTVHEVWSPPVSGTMLGMYRHDTETGASFYELQLIAEEEGSLVWKVKHFDPALSGWEEKDDFMAFPLVELGDGVAYFDGLTARREGPDRLTIHLRVRSGDSVSEETLHYRRAPLTPSGD